MIPAQRKENRDNKPYDVAAAREAARRSVERGAVTDEYPLDLKQAVSYLNEALATEILCTLRYWHHQIVAKGIDSPQVAAEFAEHAEEEQKHLMMIAERIDQLGGAPDLNPATISPRSVAEYGRGSGSLQEMIREDLISERVVIDVYRGMIQWFGAGDPTTRRMLEGILADEEEHATDLATLLEKMEPNHGVI